MTDDPPPTCTARDVARILATVHPDTYQAVARTGTVRVTVTPAAIDRLLPPLRSLANEEEATESLLHDAVRALRDAGLAAAQWSTFATVRTDDWPLTTDAPTTESDPS